MKHGFGNVIFAETYWRLWCDCGHKVEGGSELACVRGMAHHLASVLSASSNNTSAESKEVPDGVA